MEYTFTSLSVFCGSSSGNDDLIFKAAQETGQVLAKQGIQVVYGGAKVGLMGAVADAALAAGGLVVGVIPERLMLKEIAHDKLSELIVVQTMSERKKLMDSRSEGAIILPGGFGTMDELFEMLTWGQLGLHDKPVGVLNVNGFYDSLLQCLDMMADKGILRQNNRSMLLDSENIQELLQKMQRYKAPEKPGWITAEDL